MKSKILQVKTTAGFVSLIVAVWLFGSGHLQVSVGGVMSQLPDGWGGVRRWLPVRVQGLDADCWELPPPPWVSCSLLASELPHRECEYSKRSR